MSTLILAPNHIIASAANQRSRLRASWFVMLDTVTPTKSRTSVQSAITQVWSLANLRGTSVAILVNGLISARIAHMHPRTLLSSSGISASTLERNHINVSERLDEYLKPFSSSVFSFRWHLPCSFHSVEFIESAQDDPLCGWEASVPVWTLPYDLRSQNWLENSCSEAPHKRGTDQMQAMRPRFPRSLQLQDPCQDSRGWEVLSLWTLCVRFNLCQALGVAHADSLRSEAVPMQILWAELPSKAAFEETWEYLPQSWLRCRYASWKESQLPNLRQSFPSQRELNAPHGVSWHVWRSINSASAK